MGKYQNRYQGYEFKINWTSSKPFDPKNEAVEVRLTTKEGQEYYANFTTKGFVDYMFEKNKRTGECAGGTYFCMPNMILVEEISNPNIKSTIDDLIDNLEVETHFRTVN